MPFCEKVELGAVMIVTVEDTVEPNVLLVGLLDKLLNLVVKLVEVVIGDGEAVEVVLSTAVLFILPSVGTGVVDTGVG